MDKYVSDYIVNSVLPVHHVDTSSFKQLVSGLTARRFQSRCRQTVMKQIEQEFKNKVFDLKVKLATLTTVCTTVDCWTSRRRGFIGMTVHWIEEQTLERKGACLAVREILGRHTYDVLAKIISSVNEEFGITKKVCFTVTDSGSNFIKAFRHYSMNVEVDNENTSEEDDIEDFEPVDVMRILNHHSVFSVFSSEMASEHGNAGDLYKEIDDNNGNTQTTEEEPDEDEPEPAITLPRHRKCAAHRLNLVATTDIAKLEGQLKTTSVQTFAKLSGLWNKQNRSVTSANAIKTALGTLLVTPGDTRWNSYYDAVARVHAILTNPDLEPQFDTLCDELQIKRLLPRQKRFIGEYVLVMKPVCDGLDKLQGEREVGLGYLLPTLYVMNSKLESLLQPDSNNVVQLTVCEPLVHSLKNAIAARFDENNDKEAQLAAVVNPRFKLYWVDDLHEQSRLRSILKERVAVLLSLNSTQPRPSTSTSVDSSISDPGLSSASTTPDEFFSSLRVRREIRLSQVPESADSEVEKYLADPAVELESLKAYPHIRQLYILLNTGLPSSAAVERLFSLGGRVFVPLRTRMSSEHFEMMLFLRMAKF